MTQTDFKPVHDALDRVARTISGAYERANKGVRAIEMLEEVAGGPIAEHAQLKASFIRLITSLTEGMVAAQTLREVVTSIEKSKVVATPALKGPQPPILSGNPEPLLEEFQDEAREAHAALPHEAEDEERALREGIAAIDRNLKLLPTPTFLTNPPKSFANWVRETVYLLPTSAFTSEDVEKLMRWRSESSDRKLPRNARKQIATMLLKLVHEKSLVIERPGSGRTPARYRRVPPKPVEEHL